SVIGYPLARSIFQSVSCAISDFDEGIVSSAMTRLRALPVGRATLRLPIFRTSAWSATRRSCSRKRASSVILG
ncbi:MAG: hypothetical protein ACK559_16165, partial [bacterium]